MPLKTFLMLSKRQILSIRNAVLFQRHYFLITKQLAKQVWKITEQKPCGQTLFSVAPTTLTLLTTSHLPMLLVNIEQVSQLVWFEWNKDLLWLEATRLRDINLYHHVAFTWFFFHNLIFVCYLCQQITKQQKMKSFEAGSKAKKRVIICRGNTFCVDN